MEQNKDKKIWCRIDKKEIFNMSIANGIKIERKFWYPGWTKTTCPFWIFYKLSLNLEGMNCIPYFQILNRSIDSIVRRPYSLNDGGSLIIKFKDLKHFKIDINGGEEFNNVADSLEKLSAVGKKDHFKLTYLNTSLF